MKFQALILSLAKGENDWEYMSQSFISVFVCLILVAAVYFIVRYISRNRIFGKTRGNISIIEAVSVGLQSTVQLVKVGSRFFFIGASRDRVVFLSEIEASDVSIPEQKVFNKGVFENYLQKLLRKNESSDSDSGDDNESGD